MSLSLDFPKSPSFLQPSQLIANLLQPKASLAELTSYRVGGQAEWLAAPRTIDELYACLEWAGQRELPITVIGAGSNLLISDRGLPGLVLNTRRFRGSALDADTGLLTAFAGESIVKVAYKAAKQGLQGLEWAVGIPGTVGGAVVMNAGAHNACTADVFESVEILTADGRLATLTRDELQFSYRHSALQGSGAIVLQAMFQLETGGIPAEITAKTSDNLHLRKSTQPYELPSCGSVFRNPLPQAAGWLVEQTGLKGFRIGGAQVAERHANFIVNIEKARANDVLALIRHVQAEVKSRWSVDLHPEVKLLGKFSV
ncbi:MAG: UDP-N-acetylmuramate dehydrogenase [Cyanobacteria bacterium P01_H01_bin.15]